MNSYNHFDPCQDETLSRSWREMSSKFLSNDGLTPSQKQQLQPLSPSERLDLILKHQSLHVRASDLTLYLENAGLFHLKKHFQLIVSTIFGPASNYPAWPLRSISKGHSHLQEFDILSKLLGPTGPLVNLATRLLEEPSYFLEVDLDTLPAVISRLIQLGGEDLPAYFASRLIAINFIDTSNSSLMIECLRLNSFEFLMLSFAATICGGPASSPGNRDYLRGWGMSDDNLFHHLVEEFLTHFFPCDGHGVPADNFRMTYQQPFLIDPVWKDAKESEAPKLIKTGLLEHQSKLSSSGGADFFQKSEIQKEIWRSERILTIWSELWMVDAERKKNASPGDQVVLPSVDVVKTVRMIVRHLHLFRESLMASVMHPMQELKRDVFPAFEKKLYKFLRHLFVTWPLDNSFRVVYETWLSFLQPWRYVQRSALLEDGEESHPPLDISKWQPFVLENILFYTKLFGVMLNRWNRVEFATIKNALMFYRVAKVFCGQEALKGILKEIDSRILGGVKSGRFRIGSLEQLVKSWESPDFIYEPLFSEENRKVMRSLLSSTAVAICQLQDLVDATLAQQSGNLPWWDTLFGFGNDSSPVVGQSIAEVEKAITQLQFGRTQFATFFDIQIGDSTDSPKPGNSTYEASNSAGNSLFASTLDGSVLEGTENRVKVLPSSVFSCEALVPKGNPDCAPFRSDEIPFLVAFMKGVSDLLNENFYEVIKITYLQRNWIGRISRAMFAAPVEYLDIEKRRRKMIKKEKKVLPPRVVLRGVCSKNFVCVFGAFVATCLLFGLSPVGTGGVMLLLWGLVVLVKAVSQPEPNWDELEELCRRIEID
ncbi:Sphingomyelin phosphodiesterase 4 [Orchesella cincta]|uniref:Sphingomyelin phosphodiesterase 4 n=1 Tax=Orchesella cincta TaxID=48709 RepID=A0A1D2MFL8_ORCCI|nr:Sphingomyelin phosphodiesterase 4 [Orchesella cincta]